MDLTGPLHQDHAFLRKKLTLLEFAMESVPDTRILVRELCGSIQKYLQEHLQREERAMQLYYSAPLANPDIPRIHDHAAELALFRGVNELLLGGLRVSSPMVMLRLSQAIEQLRARIEEQETRVFPVLYEQMGGRPMERAHPPISGAMSVNEILQRYPRTGPVFEQLHVNRLREGYESVDEVAWRHGVDPSEMVEHLRDMVTKSGRY